jgi:hypothetical protein
MRFYWKPSRVPFPQFAGSLVAVRTSGPTCALNDIRGKAFSLACRLFPIAFARSSRAERRSPIRRLRPHGRNAPGRRPALPGSCPIASRHDVGCSRSHTAFCKTGPRSASSFESLRAPSRLESFSGIARMNPPAAESSSPSAPIRGKSAWASARSAVKFGAWRFRAPVRAARSFPGANKCKARSMRP